MKGTSADGIGLVNYLEHRRALALSYHCRLSRSRSDDSKMSVYMRIALRHRYFAALLRYQKNTKTSLPTTLS